MRHYAEVAEEAGQSIYDFLAGVITDIEMPEMDGFSLTRHIREDSRLQDLPILMHSSLSGQCNIEKGKEMGVTDYVTKFQPAELRDKLVKHLGRSQVAPVVG